MPVRTKARDTWDYSLVPTWMHVKFDKTTGAHNVVVHYWQYRALLHFEDHVCVEAAVGQAKFQFRLLITQLNARYAAITAITARLKS